MPHDHADYEAGMRAASVPLPFICSLRLSLRL